MQLLIECREGRHRPEKIQPQLPHRLPAQRAAHSVEADLAFCSTGCCIH